MSGRVQLSRAVQCQPDVGTCNNKTKDPSLKCQHHRRSGGSGFVVAQYREPGTATIRLRVGTVMRAVTDPNHPDHQRMIDIFRVNRGMMDHYPGVEVRSPEEVRIRGAFTPASSKLHYDGGSYELQQGESVTLDGVRFTRDGYNVTAVAEAEGGDLTDARALLMQARQDAWRHNYCEPGAVDTVAGEQYDDVAEAFAQMRLLAQVRDGMDETTTVDYIGRDDGLTVRFRDAQTGIEERYTYEFGGLENAEARERPEGVEVHESYSFAPERSSVRLRSGGKEIEEPIGDVYLERRQAQLATVERALRVVARFGYWDDYGFRIPVGWNSKDLLENSAPAFAR